MHAKESGHWYDRDGNPVFTVKAKNGENRDATLADARKSGYLPGVTTIIRCAAAPGLERWKQEQVLLAALTLPRIPDESEQNYIRRIFDDAKEQARKAAARGTTIHAAIQGHYEGKAPAEEYWPYVRATVDAVRERFGEQQWVAEQSFASPLGYGGKIDLHSDAVLLDFKTKEFDTTDKKLAWDEQCMQLAAYDLGLDRVGRRLANVFVSTKVPGLVHIHEWEMAEVFRASQMFSGLLAYWKASKGYQSGF